MGGVAVLRSYGTMLPIFLVGVVLVTLAVPRVVAYAYAAKTQSLKAQSDEAMLDLPQKITALRSGASWLSSDNRLQQELGEAFLAEARGAGGRDAPDTGKASATFAEALAGAPNRSLLWCLMAIANDAEGGDEERLAGYLRLNYLTGPYSDSCASARVRIAVSHWEAMPETLQERVGADIALQWKTPAMRRPLTENYLRMNFAERVIIRRYVIGENGDSAAFDAALVATIRARQAP